MDSRWWAVVLALATMTFGLVYGSTAGSSSDAYGYVSQADLWREGRLVVNQPFVEDLPFEYRQWMASPLGYRPSLREDEPWALVPSYAPGLPLLMAGAKSLGGQEAMFWIVPLSAALLVLATYGIGRRLASPAVGLVGAWLMATSPVLLFMVVFPMSDVPVSACWAVSFYALLRPTPRAAWAAGTAAALAILIRPNTAIGAPILACWFLAQWAVTPIDRRAVGKRGVMFVLGVVPGVLLVALINQQLNGSPLVSGYGSLAEMFGSAHVRPNMAQYAAWLTAAHTPVVWVGLVSLVLPLRRWWPAAPHPIAVTIGALFAAAVWVMYCFYLVFDAWWFLRFMLPALPMLLLGVGAIAARLASRHRGVLLAVAATTVLLGVLNVRFTLAEHVTNLWRVERRFPSVARLTRTLTGPRSVVFSVQHSGTLRYYAGRLTFRFDAMGTDAIDDVVAWLEGRKIHPYLLIEDAERPLFERLHAGQRALGRLQEVPLLIYTGPATIRLFDLADRRVIEAPVKFNETDEGGRSVPPERLPHLAMQRWTEDPR